GPAADGIRASHQRQDGQDAWPYDPAVSVSAGGSSAVACARPTRPTPPSSSRIRGCSMSPYDRAVRPCESRRSEMRAHFALLLGAMFALSPVNGVAGEKQIADLKELAGSWQGWVRTEFGREHATMVVQEDGTYKASTTRGTLTEGSFYLRDGKLRY